MEFQPELAVSIFARATAAGESLNSMLFSQGDLCQSTVASAALGRVVLF